MELRHLRYFIAVAEELSFTRAAARLHVAQPSLSVQIANLEREVGTPLFSRESRGVQLTEAGRIYLDRTRQLLKLARQGVTDARRAASGEVGQLSIGQVTCAEFRVFPHIVPAFMASFPDVHLDFRNMRSAQQVEAIRADELQIGFCWLPLPSADGLDIRPLLSEPLDAVIPASHPLAEREAVSIADLSNVPLVMFARALDPGSAFKIEQLFTGAGAEMRVVQEVEQVLTVLAFIAMGLGCSLLPSYTQRVNVKGVVYRPLRPATTSSLAAVRSLSSGALSQRFFDFTNDHLNESHSPITYN